MRTFMMRASLTLFCYLCGLGFASAASDISGTVKSSKGPEAGVWVIAETTDLPTKYGKIVVTDDQGRFLIPELPSA